jgi:hypothetical protein
MDDVLVTQRLHNLEASVGYKDADSERKVPENHL